MPNYLTFMLTGFPEVILSLALSLALSGRSFWDARIILAGFVGSSMVYFIRSLPLPFGVHMLFWLFFGVTVLIFLFRVKTIISFRSVLIAFSILIISESASLELMLSITGKTFEEVTSRPHLWALFSLPYLAVMAGATWLVHFYMLKKNSSKTKVGL